MSAPQHPSSPTPAGEGLIAEVIAVGDEMTTGQRLDTNSKWLSGQLCDLGVSIGFHTTVADDLPRQTDVIRIAARRADVVILTGGLGPTKDDLTRQALADAAGVELDFDESVVAHMRGLFERFGREMPESNLVQAHRPVGSSFIHNPQGTAPGVDFPIASATPLSIDPPSASAIPVNCRFFALPGVPAEMKQMWDSHVQPAIAALCPDAMVIHHHVIRCFGIGESGAEAMLPEMMRRDRDPRVGITASKATISFRITTRAASKAECLEKMQPTINEIRSVMQEKAFGENDDTLEQVIHQMLVDRGLKIAVVDFQFSGSAARLLQTGMPADGQTALAGMVALNSSPDAWTGQAESARALNDAAVKVRNEFRADIGIAIGPLNPLDEDPTAGAFQLAIADAGSNDLIELIHAGHSAMREMRSSKHILNSVRLKLIGHSKTE